MSALALALARDDDHKVPRVDDELGPLLQRALRHPILTPAGEVRLARRIERGDLAAKDLMIESNLRLVAAIARRYRGGALAYSDLVQEGVLGLVRAVEKFDHRRGLKFSTYATFWIRREIVNALGEQKTIRIPPEARRRIVAIENAEQELGHSASDEELAAHVGARTSTVRALRDRARVTASLDGPPADDDRVTLAEQVADETVDISESVAEADSAQQLHGVVALLPPSHRDVIERHFGLDGGRPETHGQIAERLGVSEARSCQLEREALQRLRQLASRWSVHDRGT
jgi:RNA polymerase primary sigma factor